MVGNSAIRNIIREDRLLELRRNIEVSSKEEGMQTMDQALADLVKRNVVTLEEAVTKSSNPMQLKHSFQLGSYDSLFSVENDKTDIGVDDKLSQRLTS